jgi:hypothetical protein
MRRKCTRVLQGHYSESKESNGALLDRRTPVQFYVTAEWVGGVKFGGDDHDDDCVALFRLPSTSTTNTMKNPYSKEEIEKQRAKTKREQEALEKEKEASSKKTTKAPPQ